MDSEIQTKKMFSKKRKILEYVIDETLIKVGCSELICLWVTLETKKNKRILALNIFPKREKHMFVAHTYREREVYSRLYKIHGKHSIVSTDRYTWYPPQQACQFLKEVEHHISIPIMKKVS